MEFARFFAPNRPGSIGAKSTFSGTRAVASAIAISIVSDVDTALAASPRSCSTRGAPAIVDANLDERRRVPQMGGAFGRRPRLSAPDRQTAPTDPVAPRHFGNIGPRSRALRNDPRLLVRAPSPASPRPRDQLSPAIPLTLMSDIVHGTLRSLALVQPCATLAHPITNRQMGCSYRLR